ncbi:MAG: FAD-binding protein [Desulfobulbaceae bacterium]|nr:FAD-binding protein [Desulfobulbaceae bacterium]
MDRKTIKKLRKIVGDEHFTISREDIICYSYDGTGQEFPPDAIAFPASTAEISSIMKLAQEASFPVVPRGAGSGMTGGSLPVQGGLVLAMSRLNRILEIDLKNQIAVVEPGVITGDFRNELKTKGLYYPPDPASLKFCTMGGNAAECAGGPSAVKYGVTRDYVLGLEVVLADGRIMQTGVRTAKGVVGYDLARLFIGSEGTLGIITKIIVKVIPLPQAKRTLLLLCNSITRATQLVSEILAEHQPCTLEYMDRTAIKIVREKIPFTLPPQVEALLLLEVDGSHQSVITQTSALKEYLEKAEGLVEFKEARDENEVASLWTARRAVSPAAFELKPHKTSEDVVVPRSKIPELVSHTENLARQNQLTIFTFGHAGDGNIHVNIMLNKEDPDEKEGARVAKESLFRKVIELGGTLSGEHGIGITKADFLPLELDPVNMNVMRELKKLFDPQNILNPGKIFPLT